MHSYQLQIRKCSLKEDHALSFCLSSLADDALHFIHPGLGDCFRNLSYPVYTNKVFVISMEFLFSNLETCRGDRLGFFLHPVSRL